MTNRSYEEEVCLKGFGREGFDYKNPETIMMVTHSEDKVEISYPNGLSFSIKPIDLLEIAKAHKYYRSDKHPEWKMYDHCGLIIDYKEENY